MSNSNYKQEVLWLTVLYRLCEKHEAIPLLTQGTQYEFIEKDLNDMHLAGLIEPLKELWIPTSKAFPVIRKMLSIYDTIYKFEIYGTVHVALKLPPEKCTPEGDLQDQFFDPRFDPNLPASPDNGTEDLRIAMFKFLADEFGAGENFNPARIIFMQMLAHGKISGEDVFFNLKAGAIFSYIDSILLSAYKWTDLASNAVDASKAMKMIYMAGQIEQRKRNGDCCTKCSIPLACFDADGTLQQCPNPECLAKFGEPSIRFKCPNCSKYLSAHKPCCKHCGAKIDFSLPAGTIQHDTVATTTTDTVTVWNTLYDYSPVGYFDIYNPYENQTVIVETWEETLW